MPRIDFIFIGGFLGAGKTTAIAKLAERLSAAGRRVGLITNDQSQALVDSEILRQRGFSVEEITGGCFCCKFPALIEAAGELARQGELDVIIAEPVGSCTDVKATVGYPMRKIHGEQYQVAPLSVMVDPLRLRRGWGLDQGETFLPEIQYIYEKQLEEAQIIAINKVDLLAPGQLQELKALLARRYEAPLVEVTARDGAGLEQWFQMILSGQLHSKPAMDIDYAAYAVGEAHLGWLNCVADVSGGPVDGDQLLRELARRIVEEFNRRGIQTAHLKMTLRSDSGGPVGMVNVTLADRPAETSQRLGSPLTRGELIINARAQGQPQAMRRIVEQAMRQAGADAGVSLTRIRQMESFRPARPVPTHRMAEP